MSWFRARPCSSLSCSCSDLPGCARPDRVLDQHAPVCREPCGEYLRRRLRKQCRGRGLGSLMAGLLHDYAGSYRPSFVFSICALLVAVLPFWRVPEFARFPHAPVLAPLAPGRRGRLCAKIAVIRRQVIAMQKYQMYIDGKYVDAASGKWFDSYNPIRRALGADRTGQCEDADRAVRAAQQAFIAGPGRNSARASAACCCTGWANWWRATRESWPRPRCATTAS